MRRAIPILFSGALASLVLACGQSNGDWGSATASATTAKPPPPPPVASSSAPVAKKPPRACPDGADMTFDGADPELEGALRIQLKQKDGAIKKADLSKVKSLNLSRAKVSEMDPCVGPLVTGLKDLTLAPGTFDDLKTLPPAKDLTTLIAFGTAVSDVSALSNYPKLDRLDLSKTNVVDLSVVAKLKDLTELRINDTKVADLKPLEGLEKLEVLEIRNTLVVDLSPLKGAKKLKTLDVHGSKVTDLSPVKELPKIHIVQSNK